MVKLQKHKAYTYKADSGEQIDHYKFLITVPEVALNQLGWSEGQELSTIIKGQSLILKPKDANNVNAK